MHDIQRHLLYEIKKQANKRAQPFHNPNSQDDDIRAQNQRLRTQIRSKDTEIIRLTGKVDELNQKLLFQTKKFDLQSTNNQANMKQKVSQLSSVPMLLQCKQLKQQNQLLHQQNMITNAKNNQLQAQLRQLKSEKYGLQLKIKQFNILQKIRQQKFQDQVNRLTPIIVQQPSEYSKIKQSTRYLTGFIRQKVNEVVDSIFVLSTKQCENNKKLNSFTVFKNYWRQIQVKRNYGYAAVTNSYNALKKVIKMIDQKYGTIELQSGQLEGTIDEWVVSNIIQIRSAVNVGPNEQQRKLFRLLALKYRCKFPIKGQHWEMSENVKAYLQNAICEQVSRILLVQTPSKKSRNQQSKE